MASKVQRGLIGRVRRTLWPLHDLGVAQVVPGQSSIVGLDAYACGAIGRYQRTRQAVTGHGSL